MQIRCTQIKEVKFFSLTNPSFLKIHLNQLSRIIFLLYFASKFSLKIESFDSINLLPYFQFCNRIEIVKFFPFQFCIVENIRFEFPTWINELEFQTVEPITRLFLNNTPYTLQICCTFQAHKHSSYYLLIFKRINIGRKDEGEKRSIISFRSSFFDLSLDRYRRREEIPKRLPRKVSPVGY